MYKEMMDTIGLVNTVDPELGAAMNRELTRQRQNIELIASENIVSPAVMAAMGSVLTNKYAEGLPGKRYYGGCVYVDEVENIAIQRACKLFGARYANVQPHSGAQANLAVYFALLDLGDTVMGMDLSQGGHLTHGSPVNMSGKNYHFVSYGVNADGVIDYAELEKQVKKVRPKLIVAGASAYPRAIDFEKIAEIAHGYGAFLMVDMAHIAGLVAGGRAPEPGALCRCGDHHHPQDPARPPRRSDPDQQPGHCQAHQLGRVPRHPGRPAGARHRRQGRLLRRGPQAGVQGVCPQDRGERSGSGRSSAGTRRQAGVRRYRQPSDADRPA